MDGGLLIGMVVASGVGALVAWKAGGEAERGGKARRAEAPQDVETRGRSSAPRRPRRAAPEEDETAFAERLRQRVARLGAGREEDVVDGRWSVELSPHRVTVRGLFELGVGPVFELRPMRAFPLFQGRDVPVGDPRFDAAFHLRTRNEDWLRRLLTPKRRAAILLLEEDVSIAGDGAFVHVTLEAPMGAPDDDLGPELRRERALELARGLASSDAQSAQRLCERAGARWESSRGTHWAARTPARALFDAGGGRVETRWLSSEPAPRFVLTSPDDLALLRARVRTGTRERIPPILSPHATLLNATPPGLLVLNGEEVRLTLDAEPSPPELAAAARLVATLSSPRVHGGASR